MNVPQDTIGRVAIRLGRAYQHPWARSITSSAVWDWQTCVEAIKASTSKNKPEVRDNSSVLWGHNGSSTTWELRPSRVALFFHDKGTATDNAGNIQLSEDSAGNPAIRIFLERWRGMSRQNLWRFDRAATSFSCDRWKVFYKMPPLTVIQEALDGDVPEVPVIVWFVVDSQGRPTMYVAPKEEEHADEVAPFARRIADMTRQGLVENWHRLLVRRPA